MFNTKAQTLEEFRKIIDGAKIPKSVFFTVSDWRNKKIECIFKIKEMGFQLYAVRSSCIMEDTEAGSNAGKYSSLLNVSLEDLEFSINSVIESYDGNWENEILIQPMLESVVLSGVGFTHDLSTCSPYRVINWVNNSDTTSITSGKLNGRTWIQSASNKVSPPEEIELVIELIDEISKIVKNSPIDIEFAVTINNDSRTLWLLQIRPLILSEESELLEKQSKRLSTIETELKNYMCPHPFLLGDTTMFGIMPDWNPAEIIGLKPRSLSLSLYRELITDTIWAYQRNNYGYRNLRSFPLMSDFFGVPYIDVRVSFNSFIPANLESGLAEKLVNHYLEHLSSEPTLHDKIEFEIVFSCFTLDLPLRIAKLKEFNFSENECNEIIDCLRVLTNKLVEPLNGLLINDEKRLTALTERRNKIMNSNLDDFGKIYWLIEDCKRYGTLPFAGLARAGFVAVQMLKSLVTTGIFTTEEYEGFLSSTSTVSKNLISDRFLMSKTDFLKKYGHLRPGTYDILSPSYSENPSLYLDEEKIPPENKDDTFFVTESKLYEINQILKSHRLEIDSSELLLFIRKGIELREYSKFEFTKNLSQVISLISKIGKENGFTLDDLSYSNIQVFKEIHLSLTDRHLELSKSINMGRELYSQTSKISLPPLIKKPDDVWGFEYPDMVPNFITNLQIVAKVCKDVQHKTDLAGKIVCIKNADPGFDWIFTYNIAGLVTAWGGANSHMAIRANELNIPAVIGIGELQFEKFAHADKVYIDCGNQIIKVVHD